MGMKMQTYAPRDTKEAFPFSFGYGIFDMEPAGPSLCGFGLLDAIPQEPNAESFMALRLESAALLHLRIEKFNIDDYTMERKKAGYICEQEGMGLVQIISQVN